MPTQVPKENFGARADAPATSRMSDEGRLNQMRDRLTSLGDEARSIRSQIPSGLESDVERIQTQMQRLGERLAELSGGVYAPNAYRAARHISEDVILLGAPAQSEGGWDAAAADALTQLYESGEPFQSGSSRSLPGQREDDGAGATRLPATLVRDESRGQAGGRAGGAASHSEEGAPGTLWLNERFAEIARRIEQSLAEIRPESSLLRIGQRFDQLEQRMTSVLSGVATRADLKELRVAEAQIDDIGAQLKQLRRQLTRLDSIDTHLGRLSEQLSDDRVTRLATTRGGADRDDTRLAAIDTCLQTLSAQLSREQLAEVVSQNAGGGVGELRGLLENLIHERRHNDENNASMLETMQQAIIRVLDRLDGLELGHQRDNAPGQRSAPAMGAQESADPVYQPMDDEVARFAAELQSIEQEHAYEAPRASLFQVEDEPAAPVAPEIPEIEFTTAAFDLDTAFSRDGDGFGPTYGAPQAPAEADSARAGSMRQDFIADAHRAKLKAATRLDPGGDRMLDRPTEVAAKLSSAGTVKPRKRRSIFNFRSPRVFMGILTLLAMIPAAIFFMPRASDDEHADAIAKGALSDQGHNVMSRDGDAFGHDAPAAIEPAPAAPGDAPPADDLPRKQSQQLDPAAPNNPNFYEDASQPATNIGYDHIDTASLPTKVSFGPDAATALIPSANGLATGSEDSAAQTDKTPALPPATVGPYSLRIAASKGDPSAQFEVAVRLAEGAGTEPDLKQSMQWYQRSAASGFAMAQFRLATLYERGVGVKVDLARAQVWYTRAAQQGNVKAVHNLAVLLAGRGGGKPDYPQAAKLFGQSAAYGLADSQFNLAMLYESGLGVPRDLKEAYKWLILASQSGDKESATRRDALKLQLSEADRATAETMAKTFRAKSMNPVANDFRAAGQAWRQGPTGVQRQG